MFQARLVAVLAITLLALGMIPANGNAQAAATQEKLSKKELKILIASAKTAENHERIAAYYRAEGERLKVGQKQHEVELAAYLKNPSSHPVPKWPTMDRHCRQLAFSYGQATQKAFALANLHDQMARDAKQK